jgi:16S rRNA (uracil1498-N3)-methyltransferase
MNGTERRETALIVGPEGGLTDVELSGLRASGATFVRLAQHVLRVETAALAAASAWADGQLP